MDYRALISSMGSSSANRMTTTVTIPEGMTEAQIFSLLEEKGVSTVEQLEEAAANYDFKFSFLKGVVPLGDPKRLEGYLFPDTYEFYMGEEPVSVLNKMILRFDEIFTDEMRQEVQNDGRTIQDVVTVASMIEKEETDGSDQAKIASVIYNRLDNPTSETAGYLNIDATILYATGGTEVDLNADTPYNTRTHKGLTPTAIASPGVDALKAAVYPDSTRYYFYALGTTESTTSSPPTGNSRTLSPHRSGIKMAEKTIELLSPAGDMERLRMSLAYGADAVYLAGPDFGMRSFAGNFTPEELKQAVELCHSRGWLSTSPATPCPATTRRPACRSGWSSSRRQGWTPPSWPTWGCSPC